MSKPVMGRILSPDKEYHRDATHVPIVAAIADQDLFPGQQIELYKDVDNKIMAKPAVGKKVMAVVDPFIQAYAVQAGEKFYCWIKPNTTKELWHEWKHPLFD